ncbi:unnamed protein product [Euphydryas editha]|nr:unnamed protein product [Euphydryas editha]
MFFNNLEALQIKHQFDANRVYNVDETGISNVQRNSRILAPKGQKQVGMITSGERGITITVVCAFSASGNYIPPFFIFKRKRMNAQLLRGGNSDMVAAVSDSGWINENLFVDWLHHFISYAKPSVEKPILLVLDNHESHVSLTCYLLCCKNGIVLLSLPPHTSHRMQPLDLTYFGPLKTAYNRECDSYMASNVGRRITQYEVVELFTKAFNRVSNIEKAANGFRAAGIWPLDATKFDEQFLEATSPDIQSIPSNNQCTQVAQEAHTSEEKGTIAPEAQTIKSMCQITNLDESIPLTEIANVPEISQPKTRQTSRKRHSTIITSTPMTDALEEKEQKRKKKEQIKFNENIVNKDKKDVKNLKFSENKNNKEKKNTEKVKSKSQEEHFCLICDEKYEEPIIEDWIMCYKCQLWAHEKCTSGESTSKGYLCDLCSD